MEILVAYFSGTGNTAYCAEYIKNHLEQPGIRIKTVSVEHLLNTDLAQYDAVIFGFPVYACDVPILMKNYLKQINPGSVSTAYLFCTAGAYSGNALHHAAVRLKAVGCRVAGWADVTMPGSNALAFLNKDSPAAKKMCSRDFSRIESLDRLIAKIRSDFAESGEHAREIRDVRVPLKLIGIVTDGVVHLGYTPLRKWMVRKFYADDNCIRCGYCEKICPAGNIRVTDEGVRFDGSCFLCMRCVHQCPQEAIQIGSKTVGKMRWKGPDGRYRPLDEI
ncbi:MAG: hypothetical protein ACFWUC_04720 [Oscillospiraceae bacterium]|jgi:ferredoxin